MHNYRSLTATLLFIVSAGCSESTGDSTEHLGVASQALSTSDIRISAVPGSGGPGPFAETSVAIDSAGAAVVGFINQDLSVAGHDAWAISSNWGSGSPTWTHSDSNVASWPSLTMSDGTSSHSYAGDPIVRATNTAGRFVYSSLILSGSDFDAIVALSEDSGATWFSQKRISTLAGGNSAVDQPKISYNSGNNTFWSCWRDTSGTGSNRVYIRKFHVDTTTTPHSFAYDPIGPSSTTTPLRIDGTTNAPSAGSKCSIWSGETKQGSGLYMAWSDVEDDLPVGGECGTSTDYTWSIPMHWYLSYTVDDAKTWSKSSAIHTDQAFPRCVGLGRKQFFDARGANYANRNPAKISYDDVRDQMVVALTHSDNLDADNTLGCHIHIYASPNLSTFTDIGPTPEPPPYRYDNWGQALSITPDSSGSGNRITASYYTTAEDSNNKLVRVRAFQSTNGGATWSGAINVSSGTSVPYILTDRWLDYNEAAGNANDDKVLTAWADTRTAGLASVWAGVISP